MCGERERQRDREEMREKAIEYVCVDVCVSDHRNQNWVMTVTIRLQCVRAPSVGSIRWSIEMAEGGN